MTFKLPENDDANSLESSKPSHISRGSAVQPQRVRNSKAPLDSPLLDSKPTSKSTVINASAASLASGLAHLLINVSLSGNIDESVELYALHDSGCELSILSTAAFDRICKLQKAKSKNRNFKKPALTPIKDCYVQAFDGSLTPAKGTYDVVLHFKGINGITKEYQHTVLVHDSTTHDLMLGSEFLSSTAKFLEDNNYMYLVDEYKNVGILEPETLTNILKDCCIVPLNRNSSETVPIMTKKEVVIPSRQSVHVICRALDPNLGKTRTPIPFEVTLMMVPYVKTPEALHFLDNHNHIKLIFTNTSLDDIIIPAGTICARIEFLDEDTEIIPINITPGHSAEILQINNVAFISGDEYLDESEKTKAFDEFLTTGKTTPTMTSFVENSQTITDFFVKDLTPVPFEQQFRLDHLSPQDKAYALKKLGEQEEVFSTHDYDLGKAKDFEMTIEIDETKPRIQKYYPLPLKVRGEFGQALDQMIEHNIVRECDEASLFCSNLLVTRRKNGLLRILLDGRLLNNATIRKPMNLITNYETYAHLAQKTHVSVMDMSHSFYQIPLAKEAQPYTAFFSEAHGKRFCFTRAPQGLKNSPLFLKLLTDKLLGDMSRYVISYADDILIATDKDLKHHIDIVAEVLRRLKEGGLKMRPAKINLATDTIEFLGVVWNRGKLKIPEAKLLAFKEYPIPNTPKKVKSFLGALSYYRTFIDHFAELARPLLELTVLHPKQFKWEQRHQEAFDELILAFLDYTALNVPDPNATFYVQTDASEFAAAGRVFQKDKYGQERLIACVSRTFSKAEKAYGIFRKETLALLYTLKSLDYFLRFATKLIMLIDARAIIYLRCCKESAGILMRFSQELARYEAEIFHVPGKENVVCDALSRNHPNTESVMADYKHRSVLSEKDTMILMKRLSIPYGTVFTAEEVAAYLELDSLPAPVPKKTKTQHKPGKRTVANMPKTLGKKNKKLPAISQTRTQGVILPEANLTFESNATNVTHQDLTLLCQIASDGIVTAKCLAEAQKRDPLWEDIYRDVPEPYFKHDNILFCKQNGTDKALIVLPTVLIKPLLNAKHYSLFGVHHTTARIKRDVLEIYSVDKRALIRELALLKASCIPCQYVAPIPNKQPFKRFDNVTEPRTIWAVDLIPNMPSSERGNSCIFLAIDMYTCYVQVFAVPNRSGPVLKDAVQECIIRPFGIPKFIRFDNEAGLENYAAFYNYCQSLRIDALPCSAGAPWSNGAAERAVQTIKQNLRKFVIHEHDKDHWDEYIHFVAMAHNSSLSVYGHSPEELHFGRSLPDRSDLIELHPTGVSQRDYMDFIEDKANAARTAMRLESDKQNKRVMTYRNKNRSDKTFAVGDVVLKRQTQVSVGPNSAVRPKFTGPYHIDSIRPTEASADIVHYRTGKTIHSHFSDLQKLYHDQEYARLPASFDSAMLDKLPDKYSRARYLASQPFDTQHPTQTQTQVQAQHHSGADSQFGADNLSQPDLSAVPDDLPFVNLSHINIQDRMRNGVLDCSDINIQDFVVDRDTSQRQVTSSQPHHDRDDLADWEDDFDPFNPRSQTPQHSQVDDPRPSSPPDFSQTQSYSQISTDDAEITIIKDPTAHVTITEYKDNSQPIQVHVENVDPTQRVTQVQVNPKLKPIQVKIVSEPIEGMIEDLPAIRAPRRPRRKKQPTVIQPPTENPYERVFKTYARPGSTSKYPLRSKNLPLDQANNARFIYFEPP